MVRYVVWHRFEVDSVFNRDALGSYYGRVRMRDAWPSHTRSKGEGFIRTIRMNGQPVRHDIRSEETDRGGGSVRLAYAFIFPRSLFQEWAPAARDTKGDDDDDDGGEKPRKTLRAALKAGCGPVASFQRVYPAGIDNAGTERRSGSTIRLICGVLPINRVAESLATAV